MHGHRAWGQVGQSIPTKRSDRPPQHTRFDWCPTKLAWCVDALHERRWQVSSRRLLFVSWLMGMDDVLLRGPLVCWRSTESLRQLLGSRTLMSDPSQRLFLAPLLSSVCPVDVASSPSVGCLTHTLLAAYSSAAFLDLFSS